MRILLTGGSGLLGMEILKLDKDILAPTSSELNITDYQSVETALEKYSPDVVLHLAAITSPPLHENDPEPGLRVNIIGTANVVLACHKFGKKIVYTSTDYLYFGNGPHKEEEPILPPYKFAWSKLGGECAVSMLKNSLILRLSFGIVPFAWEKVYEDQYNSKLYVDEMAPVILAATKSEAVGIMNVGGPRTSLEDYARRTRSDITTIPRPAWVPRDTSLDISKMKKFLNIIDEFSMLKHF